MLPERHLSDDALSIFANNRGHGFPLTFSFINQADYEPNTFSPRMVEDYSGHRLLVFRDGSTGLRELRLGDPPQERKWLRTYVGSNDPVPGSAQVIGGIFLTAVHPHPFELLSPEHITMQALTDAATRTDGTGQPKTGSFFGRLCQQSILAVPAAGRPRHPPRAHPDPPRRGLGDGQRRRANSRRSVHDQERLQRQFRMQSRPVLRW
jgi:hypothetical protein